MNKSNIHLWLASTCMALVYLSGVANGQLDKGRITHSFTEPVEKCIAASAESGIVAIAHVREGDRVEVGDPIASINHNVLKETLAIAIAKSQSTARLDAAKAQLELTEAQLEAVNSLLSGGHTNKFESQQKTSEHQKALSEFRAAKDELKLANLEVERIRAQIEDRIIKSPINGVITEIHKQPGENVSQTEPQYATIVRVDQLKVRFYLDAETLRNSKVNDQISLAVGPGMNPVKGSVSFVSPVIDPDSGLGRLDVVIDNRSGAIQSGIACFWKANESIASRPSTEIR